MCDSDAVVPSVSLHRPHQLLIAVINVHRQRMQKTGLRCFVWSYLAHYHSIIRIALPTTKVS